MPEQRTLLRRVLTGLVFTVIAAAAVLFLVTPARETIQAWLRPDESPRDVKRPWAIPVKLIDDKKGNFGLRISEEAMNNLEVNPVEVRAAVEARPLPPQYGTVNYDNDYLYTIRPRFPGEIVSFHQVKENHYPDPVTERDISFGDKLKQGEVLGVIWSKELGLAKAALVDAIVNKKLSEDVVARQRKAFAQGALAEALLRQSEKQLQNDLNAYRTALYPLYVWKLPPSEISAVEQEAAAILKDREKTRNPEEEVKRWAKVEIKAPVMALGPDGKPDPNRELVILEKNVNRNDFVDPGRDTPLFRLADLTRLQIWIHPPEEYLPLLQAHLEREGPGKLKWYVRFQADPGAEPMELTISRISPSLDPALKTPMVIGELKNPERKILVGQGVTATIFVPPLPDTVVVPTDAVNLVENQNLVFVRKANGEKNEYFLRRVAVAESAGKVTLVRSRLSQDDEKLSKAEKARGRRPLQTLQPGELVLTRGVVELTAALEDLQSNPGTNRGN